MVDDTMAVLHTHAIAGCLGGILTGLFAEPKLNNLFLIHMVIMLAYFMVLKWEISGPGFDKWEFSFLGFCLLSN